MKYDYEKIFNAVASAIGNACPVLLVPSELRKMTTAAITALYANESCSECDYLLIGPAMCPECANKEDIPSVK
jgi:flavoprotein